MIIYVLCAVLLYYTWVYIKKKRFISLKCYEVNDLVSVPILGFAHYLIGSNERRMKSLQLLGRTAVKHGGAAFGWLGPMPFLVVADAEIADVILKSSLDKDYIMKLLRSVIGNGLLVAPMSIWRHRRKILVPTFSTKNLTEYVKIFQKQSNVMMELLKTKVGGESFPAWNLLASNNMDSVCETVFGVDMQFQKNPDQPFLNSLAKLANIMAGRLAQPWLHSDAVFKLLPLYQEFKKHLKMLYSIVDQIMENKRKDIVDPSYNSNKREYKPFLELLLESSLQENGIAKGAYSDEELREETLTLTIAGTDTSAAALAMAVKMLSKHQDVQDKAYKEIQDIFGDSNRPVEPDDFKRMDYLEMVIKEAMRLYPSVPVILRKVTDDITLENGLLVPRGCHIMMNIWALHRNPKYWGDDAEEFKPGRFKDIVFKHPAQYMPFSYGPRNCPGSRYAMMSMKTVLATFLRNYRLLPAAEDEPPLRLSFEVMMKDLDNYRIQIDHRHKSARTDNNNIFISDQNNPYFC